MLRRLAAAHIRELQSLAVRRVSLSIFVRR